MNIQNLIKQAKKQGFEVYAPKNLSTYFFITKENKIGYCQIDRFEGAKFSTIHKPCKHAGTGYQADSMAKALEYRPSWASKDEPVLKYTCLEDFLNRHWQPLVEY